MITKVKQNGADQNKKSDNSLHYALGIPRDSAILLPNHDDLGMCWGSNQAYIDLVKSGFINSGSVMVPAPWFSDIVRLAHKNKELNIGVHLTLTSEWKGYRWRPLSTTKKSSGLIDRNGFFWSTRQVLQKNINVNAAELELRTQIEMALSNGIDVTHLDCHMGIGFIPELFDVYLKLGNDYALPVLLLKNIDTILDLYKIEKGHRYLYYQSISQLENRGYPLFDEFIITPIFKTDKAPQKYKDIIRGLRRGSSTFFSTHPNKPGDIEQIDPAMSKLRTNEYKVFRKLNGQWANKHNIKLINYKQIRDSLRKEGV